MPFWALLLMHACLRPCARVCVCACEQEVRNRWAWPLHWHIGIGCYSKRQALPHNLTHHKVQLNMNMRARARTHTKPVKGRWQIPWRRYSSLRNISVSVQPCIPHILARVRVCLASRRCTSSGVSQLAESVAQRTRPTFWVTHASCGTLSV